MRKLTFFVIPIFLLSCTTESEKQLNEDFKGEWNAKWITSSASFPGVKNIESFTMNGEIKLSESGEATIRAFGFPGCIFSSDTLEHQLTWEVKNDTLNFLNEGEENGMTYTIKDVKDDFIHLQLMEDIFLELSR